jgi:hypothetical protein
MLKEKLKLCKIEQNEVKLCLGVGCPRTCEMDQLDLGHSLCKLNLRDLESTMW